MKKQITQLTLAIAVTLPTTLPAQNLFAPQFAVAGPSEQFPFAYGGATNTLANYGLSVGPHVDGVGPVVGLSGWLGLGFFTGYQNRLWIDDTGKVGVGTVTPQSQLHIKGVNPWLTIEKNDGEAGLAIKRAGGKSWYLYSDNFFTDDFQIHGDISGENDSSPRIRLPINNKNLLFGLSGGNVGIGTSTPRATLDVAGPAIFDSIHTGIRTSQGPSSDGWAQDGLTVYSNPGAGYSSLKIASGHAPVGDRNLLSLERQGQLLFSIRMDGKVYAAGSFSCPTLELTSDRAQKQHFQSVSTKDALAKVINLPISTWAYTNSPNVRHLGPMAQDFKAAFNLGEDDKHIGAGDGIGVALAAIKGLHELVQEKNSEIAALKRESAAMKQELASVKDSVTDRLAALEKAMAKNVQQASNARPQPAPLTPLPSDGRGEPAHASLTPESAR